MERKFSYYLSERDYELIDREQNRIGMKDTNGILITNNVIYNTYRTGIVVTGRSNRVSNNLVATIYWSGAAQSSFIAQFSMNYDGAIMSSRDSFQLTMRVRNQQAILSSLLESNI